jgi:hypothetical protein
MRYWRFCFVFVSLGYDCLKREYGIWRFGDMGVMGGLLIWLRRYPGAHDALCFV